MTAVPPTYAKVQPCNFSRQAVWSLGEQTAAFMDYTPQTDIVAMLGRFGGTVKYEDFWTNDRSGSIQIHGPGSFDVYLAIGTSPSRDRFTIAHEIGHYILHYIIPRSHGQPLDKVYAERYTVDTDRAEWEANWFAASFLMPEAKFKEMFDLYRQDTVVVGHAFAVSPAAARVRAQSLNLI